ncbi:MAG: DUF1572 domain-containing protein [Chitinophagales bacterium]|nr:DUF1572 domain-containing protein [Chitinophagales bacterium]
MLSSSIKQFKYYKQLAEKAMAQITPDQLFDRLHEDDNSIAIIVHHLYGNMMSRWTNIFTEDGEKPWRHRDGEFEDMLSTPEEVYVTWDKGWSRLFETLQSLDVADLQKIIYIRNEGHTVEDAIIRQLCHYSYHCGQIVYKCKQLKADNWQTLSIAKGKSDQYNSGKFAQEKSNKHFTDNLNNSSS